MLQTALPFAIKPSLKVYMTQFFINLLGRAFRAMKNGVYFIVIAVLVAELFKIMDYANIIFGIFVKTPGIS